MENKVQMNESQNKFLIDLQQTCREALGEIFKKHLGAMNNLPAGADNSALLTLVSLAVNFFHGLCINAPLLNKDFNLEEAKSNFLAGVAFELERQFREYALNAEQNKTVSN